LTFPAWWLVRCEQPFSCGGVWAWAEALPQGGYQVIGCVEHLRLN
jgi:hypothetical protein